MPLHVAIWSQVILDSDLSWEDQGKTIRLLANAWSRGEPIERPRWAGDEAWSAFERMWPETSQARSKAGKTAAANAARAKAAADARWNASSIPDADDAPSMLQASELAALSMLDECLEHDSGDARSKEPKPNPNPNPNTDQKQEPIPSLRSGLAPAARRQCPAGFELSQERFEYGISAGLTIEAVGEEFEAFTDHRYRTPRTKWDLAWKAWVRKAVQIRGLGASRRGPPEGERFSRNSMAPVERTTHGSERDVVTSDAAVQAAVERMRRERAAAGGVA